MKIAIIYTTTNRSTKKSCEMLSKKVNADVRLIPIEKVKTECILKYDFILIASSAVNGKVQSKLKAYVSHNIKSLKGKPLGLIINCEEDTDRFNKTFTEELVETSRIKSNFGYELDPNEGNFMDKRKTAKLIENYTKDGKELPCLNTNKINEFAGYINNLIERRID
jgi:menaquinone-dependent protoporphyrinogen oxidase